MNVRQLEREFRELKLSYSHLLQANIDLVDENKLLKEDIENLRRKLEDRELEIKIYKGKLSEVIKQMKEDIENEGKDENMASNKK